MPQTEYRLNNLYRQRDNGANNLTTIEALEQELNKLDNEDYMGAKIRTRAIFGEPNEMSTKAFFAVECKRKTKIKAIYNENGNLKEDNENILKTFYENLYKHKETCSKSMAFLIGKIENKSKT
jgi:hypothetical protein